MPNRVPVVLPVQPDVSLTTVLRTIKSYTAREVNAGLGREGRFWQVESYDRLIRDPANFERTARYVEWNPVKAGLAGEPLLYPFSSAFPSNAKRLDEA